MFKRLVATLMAVTMAASMAMPVCAAEVDYAGESVITKTVQADNGVSFADEKFTFTFTQEGTFDSEGVGTGTDDSGIKANLKEAKIKDVILTMSGTSDKDRDFTQEVKTYTETSDTTAAIRDDAIDLSNIKKAGAGVYTYIVTETAGGTSNDTTTWVNDIYDSQTNTAGSRYRMRVYATNLGEMNITLVKLDENGNETGSKLTTADFTNTVVKTANFKISKNIGDETDSSNGRYYIPDGQTYDFKVEFTFDDLNKSILGVTDTSSFNYKIVDGSGSTQRTGTVKSGDTITGLPANSYIEIEGLPAGTLVTTEEINIPANVTSTTYDVIIGHTYTGIFEATKTTAILVDEDGSQVGFTNTWKDVTVTGVVTNNAPYIAMVVLAGAAVAGYVVLKRKIAR